jgi:hypothetical protein
MFSLTLKNIQIELCSAEFMQRLKSIMRNYLPSIGIFIMKMYMNTQKENAF